MDCAPLNLAHFHERRADKFLKHHRYDEAYKAIETSLLYVQDAYKNAQIPKSIEVLNTQKWDYERKLRQIQMRKLQHERLKLKEIVPTAENNSVLLKPESSVTTLSISKSIDKTIEDFDAKFNSYILDRNVNNHHPHHRLGSKENQDPKRVVTYAERTHNDEENTTPVLKPSSKQTRSNDSPCSEDSEDYPSLAPLELPSFDFNVFTTSGPTLTSIAGLAESFQK